MKLENFLPALGFLSFKFLTCNSSIKKIIKAFVYALMLSNFIFISIFENKILDFISPFITFFAIYNIINLDRCGFFWAGFFSGILWFYWISFSFIYYELAWLIPLVIFGIGVIYGLIFLAASLPSFVALRAILLFIFSYIPPFGFNWFNLEATLILGIFQPNIRGLIAIFLAAILASYLKGYLRIVAVIVSLAFGIGFENTKPVELPFSLELANTNVKQSQKWDKNLKDKFIDEAILIIDNAIALKKRAILMPENAFATFMTHEKNLQRELLEKSHKIAIIAGSLAYENGSNFNSTFLFDNGTIKRFDKVVLVPFGEEIPLPNFAKEIINKLFFNGASDFKTAKEPSNYIIDGIKIRNAICYEATTDRLFKGDFDVMFAITNNGWFKSDFFPTTQPILQRNLLKYYATKYNKIIYHSVNGSKSEIIKPKEF
ncbi:apolipoprotein N-acyltransferase [Campylobacter mucosalis]|uniref:apolipoprotein N-acyltransferase n=1 Tax=Campylobacter mucosalis TaxID=202 RepID=UPI0014703155|nr:apolipoprotein N-acyltransferase [Campylobacter mucosalis]